MIEVQEMSDREIRGVLKRMGYGHLGLINGDYPYVIPIHYVYKSGDIFFYTTEGLKTEILELNPNVCLQVEDIVDSGDWRSVVVSGSAERLEEGEGKEKARELIVQANPTLTPAISIRWMDNWVRENREAVYRITPTSWTGRSSVKVVVSAAFANSGMTRKAPIL